MRAANDGKLSRVSLYDKEGPGPGQGSYDGWSAVSGFTQRLPPLRPLLHSWTARVPQQRGVQKCAPTRGSVATWTLRGRVCCTWRACSATPRL